MKSLWGTVFFSLLLFGLPANSNAMEGDPPREGVEGKSVSGSQSFEAIKLQDSGGLRRPGSGKIPKANKGRASIIFFYFGDSYLATIGQETQRLALAMEKYKYKVLLKLDTVPSMWDLAEKDEKLANVKVAPTKKNLIDQIKSVADKGYTIDLFIFSHGRPDYFGTYPGKNGKRRLKFTKSDIENLVHKKASKSLTGYEVLPIRMVYQVNCYGSKLNSAWRKAGAKAVAGARQVNFFPNQFEVFAKEWNKGKTLKEALTKADTASSRTVVHFFYILAYDAPTTKGKPDHEGWNGCKFPNTVLGKSSGAKDYIVHRWGVDWTGDGKSSMNKASVKVISGRAKATINSKYTWK